MHCLSMGAWSVLDRLLPSWILCLSFCPIIDTAESGGFSFQRSTANQASDIAAIKDASLTIMHVK